jgi:hypothetical protein
LTGPSSSCTWCSDTRTGQDSVTVRVLADLRSPMLLLDSRSVRVTATCPVWGRHPLLRTYGTRLPNSLTPVWPDSRGLLCLSTCVGSRYGHHARLFTGSWLHRIALSRALHASCRYGFHVRPRFDRASARLGGSGSVDFRWWWHWNINQFAVDHCGLRVTLGPANPRLMSSAEEPLLVWPSGVLPDSRCYCDQDCRHHTVHTSSRPCFRPCGAPTY